MAAILLGCLVRASSFHIRFAWCGEAACGTPPGGEPLLHNIQAPFANHLPLYDLGLAVLIEHWRLSWAQVWWGLTASTAGLVVCLTVMLGYRRLVVPLLAAFVYLISDVHLAWVQTCLSMLVTLVGCFLVWRASRPSRARSIAASLAIGACLLFRSSLAFLPPLLALSEWLSRPAGRKKEALADMLILGLAPYAFLLPWIVMNWRVYHRLVIFEQAEVVCNVLTGALGLVGTVEGNWHALPGVPVSLKDSQALIWAIHFVLRHPAAYARAYAERVWFVFSLRPGLCALAAAGAWLERRRSEFRALALLAVYFLLVHCFMSVERGYFLPLWALLSPLAAAALAYPLFGKTRRFVASSHRWMEKLCQAWLALLLVACAYTEWRVASLAIRAADPQNISTWRAAMPLAPGDVWVMSRRARYLLINEPQAYGEALSYLRYADEHSSVENNVDIHYLRLIAEALNGKTDVSLAGALAQDGPTRYREEIMAAQIYRELRRPAESKRWLKAAVADYAPAVVVRDSGPQAEETLKDLRRPEDFIEDCCYFLGRWTLPYSHKKEPPEFLADVASATGVDAAKVRAVCDR